MYRPHGNPHETKAAEYLPYAAFMIFDAKLPFDDVPQINAPPPDQRSFRPPQHKLFEPLFLLRRQGAFGVPFGQLPQPLYPLGVVTDYPVPQRLPRHPGLPGSSFPVQAVQDIGNPEHPRRNTTATLLASAFFLNTTALMSRRTASPDPGIYPLPMLEKRGNHIRRQERSPLASQVIGPLV